MTAQSAPQQSSVLMHSPGNCKISPLLCTSSERRETDKKKGAKGCCQCSAPPARLSWRCSLLIPAVFPSRGVGSAGSPLCTRVPVLPCVPSLALPRESPEEPHVRGEGTPLPPLVVSLPVARLFLLTLIKEDLGELFVKGSHSLQLKAKKTTQAYH